MERQFNTTEGNGTQAIRIRWQIRLKHGWNPIWTSVFHTTKYTDQTGRPNAEEASQSASVTQSSTQGRITTPPRIWKMWWLTADLNKLLPTRAKLILGGDLNAKHNRWHSRLCTGRGRTLTTHDDTHSYYVLEPTEPARYDVNHRSDVFHIFITININYRVNIHTETVLSSDHNPVILTMDNWQDRALQYTQYKTNWRAYKHRLEDVNRDLPELNTPEDVDNEVRNVTPEIRQSFQSATTTTVRNAKDKNQLPLSYENW